MPPFPSNRRLYVLAAALCALAGTLHAVDRERLSGGIKDDFLTGDWDGRRQTLSETGVDFSFSYTAATYQNTKGGISTGGTFEASLDMGIDFDLEKLLGWTNTQLHLSSVGAHGTDISSRHVGDVNRVSSYYLDRGIYLNEVWLQKGWLDNKLTLRAGKMDADWEYPIYSYADSIPMPLYPTGALGLRLYYEPNSMWFFSTAVFDGDPNDPVSGSNPHGLHGMRLSRGEGVTSILMIGFNHDYEENAPLPPGTWKIGIYHNTRSYPDVGTGARLRGNHAYFLNGDQTLWREKPELKDDLQGLALYLVAEWAPADRNSFHYGFGGGPYYTGLFPGRDDDILYFNLLYTQFSPAYSAAQSAAGEPAYGFENRWQLYYQIAINKYFSVTPEVDYIVHPSGTGRLPNATVFGLRINIAF